MYRRNFIKTAATLAAASQFSHPSLEAQADSTNNLPFKISLAEWSLHRTLRDPSKNLTNLDFARIAKQEFDIDGIEYVNQFFKDKAKDQNYLQEMKKRAADEGVTSLLIMVDGEGSLGDPDETKRKQAAENHFKWVDAAKFLGCHSIRVNAASRGSFQEQQSLAADGLSKVSQYAAKSGLNVIVENHGGLSSNGAWLAGVIQKVGMDNCGTLPDFGNFFISRGPNPEEYDRYRGVDELMPFAKAVSAKTHDFDDDGNEIHTDYVKMMKLVVEKHGYNGYVGIEYEGGKIGEMEGIQKSKDLLLKVAKQMQTA
ncbi:sugar phosphate isomerase/epimerase [Rhodopirellula sp.]|nr:sugar phosphate isomerase/epimerase [Rhodopirellula sp.]